MVPSHPQSVACAACFTQQHQVHVPYKDDQTTQTEASIFDKLVDSKTDVTVPQTYIAQLRANLHLLRLRMCKLLDMNVSSMEVFKVLSQVEVENDLCDQEEVRNVHPPPRRALLGFLCASDIDCRADKPTPRQIE